MHKRRGEIWCYFVLALATSPMQVVAAEYYIQPSVRARYEFDNNRSLSEPAESASTWTFFPLVQFGRLTPNSSVTGAARVNVNKSNTDAVDSTDLFFGLLPTYRTERSVWTLNSTYRRDTTLRTSLFEPDFGQEPLPADLVLEEGIDDVTAPSPETTAAGTEIPGEEIPDLDDPNLQDPGIGERAQKSKRNLLVLSPRWSRELTPRMGLGLGYSYADRFYSDAEGTGLVDSRSHSGGANLSYRWSEVDNVSVITSVLNFQNDANAEFDTYRIELGWTHRFSETLRAVASGGPEYTDEAAGDSSLSYSVRFGVGKELESSNLSILFRRAVAPSEGGNALERHQIDVRWLGDISPRWSFTFLARAFRNEKAGNLASGSGDDRSYAQVEPTISYALTEDLYVDLGYRFRWQDADQSAFAHAVAVSVGYRLDRFGFSR